MKKISKLISIFLLLLSIYSNGQEVNNYKITPEISKKIIEENNIDVSFYKVDNKEVDFPIYESGEVTSENNPKQGLVLSNKTQKKQIYIINDIMSVNLDKIDGSFSKLGNKFRVVLEDIPNYFMKNQIINDEQYQEKYRKQLSKPYDLIKKLDSEEYFFITSNEYLSKLEMEQQNNEIFDIVHKLGYKEYKEPGGEYYIKSKTCEIRLDNYTLQELKENPTYISTLDNDQLKRTALVKQTIPHSKTLDKYCRLYNIQGRRMSSLDIKNWSIATANAQKLHNQIYKLSEKYHGNFSFTLLDKSDTFSIFLDNLLASKGVLGM